MNKPTIAETFIKTRKAQARKKAIKVGDTVEVDIIGTTVVGIVMDIDQAGVATLDTGQGEFEAFIGDLRQINPEDELE